jgi:hypothetical protein
MMKCKLLEGYLSTYFIDLGLNTALVLLPKILVDEAKGFKPVAT